MSDIKIQTSLNGDLVDGFKLKKSLPIIIELEEGLWVVSDPTFDEVSDGNTQEEAIANYKKVLVGYFTGVEELSKDDPDLEETVKLLSEYIDKP